jgi:hypothetical protein
VEIPNLSGNAGNVIVPNSSEDGFEFRTLLDTDTITNYNKDVFSGTGSQVAFTLSQAATIQNALEVYEVVAGVAQRQEPAVDFTVSGTTLTFVTAPASGTDNVWVIDTATSTVASVPSDGSVTSGKLAPDAITGQTSATIAAGDSILFSDVDDGGLLKQDTVQGVIDLVPARQVLQVVETVTGAVATGTTQIPYDDSIPQITEGDEYMSLAITPTSATNNLKIEVVFNFSQTGATTNTSMALFQDSTANALAAVAERNAAGGEPNQMTLIYHMVAGTVSATTFRLRAGPSGSETVTFNGVSGTRRFGGVMTSSITITEYA